MAGACTTLSVWKLRTKHMSSTHCDKCGNKSLTHIPLSPYCLKFQGELKIGVDPSVNWLPTFPKLSGNFWPSNFFSAGFGSNVSIWPGAPTINRKITRLALPAKCGCFEANGFVAAPTPAALAIIACNAKAPKPCAEARNTSRRLGNIHKLISIHQRQAELLELASLPKKLASQCRFGGPRDPRQR